ncbi:MAG: RDD family protein [Actinomycetota bacterium]|nr:RDD family protein [Actinomycetota bacterium]MDH5224435.1 RDD family protein [Actinomycetota bacterium]MDH5312602.1 RDD family protein [Actinomycetota bacterium]
MTYIGIGRRFVAWLIDALITGLAWVPFADTRSVDGVYSIRWEGMDFVIPMAITFAYFVALEGLFGATIGKVVVGIRVRSPDGSRISFGPAVIRNLARVVDAFPYVIPYLVGGIAVSRSETKQRLGDRWATTVVVLVGTESKASAPMTRPALDPSGLPSPPPGRPPVTPGAGGLPPPPPEA